jgi:hypothetical protein
MKKIFLVMCLLSSTPSIVRAETCKDCCYGACWQIVDGMTQGQGDPQAVAACTENCIHDKNPTPNTERENFCADQCKNG